MYDSWNHYHIILLALAFTKSDLRFFCAEIVQISENIESTNNADHILEMVGLREFCDYYL